MLMRAPIAFVILLAASLSLGFAGGLMWRGQEVANAESLVRLKDGELEELKKFEKRIGAIEEKLSMQQINTIESILKGSPSSIEILKDPKASAPFSNQWTDVFEKSGWSVDVSPIVQDTKAELILRSKDIKSSTTIEKALVDAGLKFEVVGVANGGGDNTTDFWLSPFKE